MFVAVEGEPGQTKHVVSLVLCYERMNYADRSGEEGGGKKKHARQPAWHGFCLTLTWVAFSSSICLVSSCLRPPGMATADGAPWLLFFSRNRNWLPLLGPSSVSMHWIRSAQLSSAALPSAGREGSEGRARGTACIHATRGSSEFEPSSLPVPQPQAHRATATTAKKKAATGHGRERQQRQSACLVLSVSVCMLWRSRFLQDASVHSFSFSKAEQSAELGISVPRQFSG